MSQSFYERAGGEKTFNDLVSHFYALVAVNPILRPMYPENDLHGAGRRLQLFLEQYWGGPTTYSEERGHPRLRMRHARFHIDVAARDAWLGAMNKAVQGMDMDEELRVQLWSYLEMAADAMVNQPD